jgi:NADH-quinone oxidoreductase subunit I
VGVKQIYRPPQNLWERLYLFEIARGLGITLKHALLSWFKPSHRVTWEYPEVRRPIAERFRGRHRIRKREDGSPLCVACYCCQTVCPPQCIDIVAEESEDPAVEKRPKEFKLNLARCLFCGMCVEACPKDAIYMSQDYELATRTREQLYLDLDDLLEDDQEGEG